MPLWLVGAAALLARGPWWPTRFQVLLPVAAVPLDWFGAPDNSDWRFISSDHRGGPAAARFHVPRETGSEPRDSPALCCGSRLAGYWPDVEYHRSPFDAAYHMRDWLSPQRARKSRSTTCHSSRSLRAQPCTAGARRIGRGTGSSLLFACSPRRVRLARPQAGLSAGWLRAVEPHLCLHQANDIDAELRDHTRDATIAYTGNNIPYLCMAIGSPIASTTSTSIVIWNGASTTTTGRKNGAGTTCGRQTRLARPRSGVLAPIAAGVAANGGAVRPRFERMEGYREAWLANLKAPMSRICSSRRLRARNRLHVARSARFSDRGGGAAGDRAGSMPRIRKSAGQDLTQESEMMRPAGSVF